MDQKTGRLPLGLEQKVIAHILRYDLHFHQSLVHPFKAKIQECSSEANELHISRTTWRVIHFLCQAHLTGDPVSLSDVFLSIGVSKGTAISCLNSLESWGVIEKTSADGDRRRLNIQFCTIYEDLIARFLCYWAERYSQEIEPQEYAGEDVDGQSIKGQLTPHIRRRLKMILTNAEMIETQALGPVQPAGYVRYANDITSLVSEMLGETKNETA